MTAGATNGNTMTVFATASGGFAGVVSLSCTIAAQGAVTLAPGCAVLPTSVTLSGAAPSGSATVTISSQAGNASGSSCGGSGGGGSPTKLGGMAGLGLALICLLLVPVARRRELRGLLMVVAAVGGMPVMTGCGGAMTGPAATASASCAAQGTSATTAGAYTVTVTGKSGGTTQSTSFTVTVQ
jgi:hypothetical protein